MCLIFKGTKGKNFDTKKFSFLISPLILLFIHTSGFCFDCNLNPSLLLTLVENSRTEGAIKCANEFGGFFFLPLSALMWSFVFSLVASSLLDV